MLKKSIFPFVLVILIAATVMVIRSKISGIDVVVSNAIDNSAVQESGLGKGVAETDTKQTETVLAPAEIATEQVHASVQVQAVTGGGLRDESIRTAVYDLPENLNSADYRALKNYLLNPQDGKDGDFRQQEYALRNYMMDALRLRAGKDRLSETADAFVRIYKEEQQGDVMRGYALQNMMLLYIDNPAALADENKQQILETFADALSNTDGGTIAATALIGLHEVSRTDPSSVSAEEVGTAALKLIESKNSGTLSRLTAFQICGELKQKEALPAARASALNPSADWGERIGAIYALGQLGATDGLDALLNDSNENIRNAAQAALKR